jgi:magnesium transporter
VSSKRRSLHSIVRRTRPRPAPGSSPGTLVSDPRAEAPKLSVLAFGPSGFEEKPAATLADVDALRGTHPVLWVNLDGLRDVELIAAIGERFGLHRLALEDVVHVDQRAKVEQYDGVLYIVMKEVELNAHVETDQISLFLGKDFLVTFQEYHGDCFGQVRDRVRRNKGKIRACGPDYLAYALLDAVIDSYYPVLEGVGERLEVLEERTVEKAAAGTVHDIHEIKRELLVLRRAIWPAREAVASLIRDPTPVIAGETRLYFRDCYDHLVQLIDMLENYRELGSDLMDIYLSSNSNRLNEVMKMLTIIATIFMPLSFLASLYGMNFDTSKPANMPELHWRYGYVFALGVMGLVASSMLLLFWRRGWLGGGRDG